MAAVGVSAMDEAFGEAAPVLVDKESAVTGALRGDRQASANRRKRR